MGGSPSLIFGAKSTSHVIGALHADIHPSCHLGDAASGHGGRDAVQFIKVSFACAGNRKVPKWCAKVLLTGWALPSGRSSTGTTMA
jgi:hypothetical protein